MKLARQCSTDGCTFIALRGELCEWCYRERERAAKADTEPPTPIEPEEPEEPEGA